MAKTQITPEELLAQSARMQELKNQYESMFQSVNGILGDINQSWSDNLANNFGAKITAAQNSFAKVVDMLQTGSNAAAGSAKTFRSVDVELASLFGGGAAISLDGVGGGIAAGFGSIGGTGLGVNVFGRTTNGLSSDYGREFIEFLYSTGKGSWESAGDVLEEFEKWRETKIGKGVEAHYDLLDDLIEDSPLGTIKKSYEITKDIINGEVSLDTVWDGIDAISGSNYYLKTISIAGRMTDPDSYYMKKMEEMESRSLELMKEGNVLGVLANTSQEFVETVGKGVVDTGCQLIEKTLHIDTISNVVEAYTGWNPLDSFNEWGADVGDHVSEGMDIITNGFIAVGEGINDGIEAVGKGIQTGAQMIGDGVEAIGDFTSDVADGIKSFLGF